MRRAWVFEVTLAWGVFRRAGARRQIPLDELNTPDSSQRPPGQISDYRPKSKVSQRKATGSTCSGSGVRRPDGSGNERSSFTVEHRGLVIETVDFPERVGIQVDLLRFPTGF